MITSLFKQPIKRYTSGKDVTTDERKEEKQQKGVDISEIELIVYVPSSLYRLVALWGYILNFKQSGTHVKVYSTSIYVYPFSKFNCPQTLLTEDLSKPELFVPLTKI